MMVHACTHSHVCENEYEELRISSVGAVGEASHTKTSKNTKTVDELWKTLQLRVLIERLIYEPLSYVPEQDWQMAQDIKNKKIKATPPLQEAALVLIFTHQMMQNLATAQSPFLHQESGVEGEVLLDAQLKKINIDIVQAFLHNRLLNNMHVAKMLNQAIRHGLLTQASATQLQFAIQGFIEEVNHLRGPVSQDHIPITEGSVEASFDAPDRANTQQHEAKKSDTAHGVLLDAQTYMDKGNYRPAIELLVAIPEEHQDYKIAQTKILDASNRGLQELRQKAAKSFQSAAPVRDVKAKIMYLKEAKSLLTQALNDYPKAAQVSTVQNNLSIIERQLAQLEK
jgi:tetratricopeptide (TPR) repeat protein